MEKSAINKKSEMTNEQIIKVVILVISFAIVLFLMSQFAFKEQITKETCHTSVILKASATLAKFEFREAVPLKCKTDKICFTSGFFSKGCPSSDLGTNYAKVSVSDANDLLDKIAENLYEWHTTLGEGKINFMERGVFENTYCILGTQMAFDDGVQKMITDSKLRYLDIYQKMSEKKTDKGTSYLKEMYGTDNIATLSSLKADEKKITDGPIDPTKTQVGLSWMREDGTWGGIALGVSAAAVVVGIAFAIPTWGSSLALTAIGPTALVAGGTGSAVYYETKPNPAEKYRYHPPQLNAFDKTALEALKCSSFESLAGDVTP